MKREKLRLGTRGSALALYQARWVARQLQSAWPQLAVELKIITTGGDRTSATWREQKLDGPQPTPPPAPPTAESSWQAAVKAVADTEGRGSPAGAFTEDLENALLNEEIDFAVHSLKDLPAEMAPGLTLAAFPQRAEPRDALILPEASAGAEASQDMTAAEAGFGPGEKSWRQLLTALPPRARVGTGSLRRHLQLLALRPDLQAVPLRGNVEQRVELLDSGACDVLVLAAAGLQRLGLDHRITALIDAQAMVPAPGQGALAVQARKGDRRVLQFLQPLQRADLKRALTAELAFLQAGEGPQRLPVGALYPVADVKGVAQLQGFYAQPAPDQGQKWLCAWGCLPLTAGDDAAAVGRRLARQLRQTVSQGGGTKVQLAGESPS